MKENLIPSAIADNKGMTSLGRLFLYQELKRHNILPS